MSIAIFAEESSLFACPFLAEALNCNLYVMLPRYNNFFGRGKIAKHWNNGKAIYEDHLIVIGYTALKNISKQIGRFKTIALILSDSSVCRQWRWWNDFVKANKITVYSMPDLIPYCRCSYIPAYQTIRIPKWMNEKPADKLIIAHSPNNSIKASLKGTSFINKTINRLRMDHNFEYRVIKDIPMDNCLKIKGSSHIFIDQMIYRNPEIPQERWGKEIIYNGGLGKSGIEAMMLGSCVITGGIKPDTGNWFPPPPVVWSSYDTFFSDLLELINYPELRKHKAKEQMKWAVKYLSYEFVSKHITQHIK